MKSDEEKLESLSKEIDKITREFVEDEYAKNCILYDIFTIEEVE